MNQYIKTTGEKLIRQFDLVVKIILFFILPAIVLYFLIIIRVPSDNFVLNLLYYFGVVYVAGGFLVLGLKMIELYDDGFVNFKRRQWKQNPILKRVFYKVCIPEGFSKTPADMAALYYDMTHLNGGLRTKHEIYNLGRWYYDWSFDIIVRNGKAEIYTSFPFKRTDFIMKTFKSKFPEIKLVQTIDPYTYWPKKWEPGKTNLGKYAGFSGFNFQLASQGPENIAYGYDLGENSPITELLESFCKFDPNNTMIIWQYVFRPYPVPDSKQSKWEKAIEEKKAEILGKSTKFKYTNEEGKIVTGTTGDLVAEKMKTYINKLETKVSEPHFKCSLKLMVFYPKGKKYYATVIEKMAKAFAGQIADNNIIKKNWFTSNDRMFLGTKNGIFDSILGPIMDKIYHSKEIIYRSKVLFEELATRDPDISNDSSEFMLSVPELCAFWHFPQMPIFAEEIEKKPAAVNQQIEVKTEKFENNQKVIHNPAQQIPTSNPNPAQINFQQQAITNPQTSQTQDKKQTQTNQTSTLPSFDRLDQLRKRNQIPKIFK